MARVGVGYPSMPAGLNLPIKSPKGRAKKAQREAYTSALAQDTEHDAAITALQGLALPPKKKALPAKKARDETQRAAYRAYEQDPERRAVSEHLNRTSLESEAVSPKKAEKRLTRDEFFLTAPQAAKRLGVTTAELSRMIARREIGAIHPAAGTRVPLPAIEAYQRRTAKKSLAAADHTSALQRLARSLDILLTLEQEHDKASHAEDERLGRTYGNKTCHVCAAIDEIWFALKDARAALPNSANAKP